MTNDLSRRLVRSLESAEFFIAHQVRIPELFIGLPSWPLEQDDHCWHEFSCIEPTNEPANDRHRRTIEEFIIEVEQQLASAGRSLIRWIVGLTGNHLRAAEEVEWHRTVQFPDEGDRAFAVVFHISDGT